MLGAVPLTSRSSVGTLSPAEAALGAWGGGGGAHACSGEGLSQAGGLAVLAQQGLCFLVGRWMPNSPLFLSSSLSVGSCPGMGARTLLSRPRAGGSTFLSQEEGSTVVSLGVAQLTLTGGLSRTDVAQMACPSCESSGLLRPSLAGDSPLLPPSPTLNGTTSLCVQTSCGRPPGRDPGTPGGSSPAFGGTRAGSRCCAPPPSLPAASHNGQQRAPQAAAEAGRGVVSPACRRLCAPLTPAFRPPSPHRPHPRRLPTPPRGPTPSLGPLPWLGAHPPSLVSILTP